MAAPAWNTGKSLRDTKAKQDEWWGAEAASAPPPVLFDNLVSNH